MPLGGVVILTIAEIFPKADRHWRLPIAARWDTAADCPDTIADHPESATGNLAEGSFHRRPVPESRCRDSHPLESNLPH